MPETPIISCIPGNHWDEIPVFILEELMKSTAKIAGKAIVGIDYGNKYAGTTVICYNSNDEIKFIQSSKNADADSFLLNELAYLHPDLIMIDAPLSLPGVYWLGNEFKDHFYRSCDRELKAMSPMFLGGLTARAISLIKRMNGTEVIETYPRKLVDILNLPAGIYKHSKLDLRSFTEQLKTITGVKMNEAQITSWHHVDALLALLSGLRYLKKNDHKYGIPEEGLIIV